MIILIGIQIAFCSLAAAEEPSTSQHSGNEADAAAVSDDATPENNPADAARSENSNSDENTDDGANDTLVADEAKVAFDEGTSYYDSGEFEQACEAFRRAYQLKPTWKLLFNIAQAEAAAKRYGVAIQFFERYLVQAGDEISLSREEEILAELTRLKMKVGIIEVDAPEGTILYIDSLERGTAPFSAPVRVAVGSHDIRLVYGEIVEEHKVTIAGNLTSRVRLEAAGSTDDEASSSIAAIDENKTTSDTMQGESDAPSGTGAAVESKRNRSLLIGGIVSSVVAAAGIGIGIAYSAKFSTDNTRWEDAAEEYESSGLLSDYETAKEANNNAKKDSTLLIVGYSIAGVAAAVAVTLFTLHTRKKRQETLGVHLAPTGMTMTF
ncbi:MAG: tetratricopeptide repeat protein [Deltaproteobacteria bacterium]|nr:tetratricopeptide repeat protein [Deltaproteobacteria bacterium]MBN2673887.1 tetratricopeptide repeat protein [Deltaproteobacteria bacterium]